MPTPSPIKRAQVSASDEAKAIAELAAALHQKEPAGTIFFCSPDYDPQRLIAQFERQFADHAALPLIGCTTAGEIGAHFRDGGITGLSFPAADFALHPLVIEDLDRLDADTLRTELTRIEGELRFSPTFNPARMFGFLLVDGLSMKEEMLAASLRMALPDIPILGGSAGDELRFERTQVFADGRFMTHGAVLVIIETRLDFELFKFQHFEPAARDLVVTEAVPNRRLVTEIDGEPAGEAYARMVGIPPGALDPQVFSAYPLMLEIGNEWYVRSIEKLNDDGSLTFYCAIDSGLPLTLAHSQGLVATLQTQTAALHERFARIDATLGCDCVLRRLEMQARGDEAAVEALLGALNFVGFNTYGEQFNGIHVNQTLVGVVLGEKHR